MAVVSLRSGAIRICFDPSLNAYPNRCRILVESVLEAGCSYRRWTGQVPSLRRHQSVVQLELALSPGVCGLLSLAARSR